MKKSIFKDGSICYWVDYSHRSDIAEVVEITQEQYQEETKPVVIEEEIIEDEIIEENPIETDEEIDESEEETTE